MRLLVVTQSVDLDNPVLGFFHGWLCALAGRFESLEVICLAEGRHELPSNVRVHSLGKERGRRPRWAYAWAFLKLAWQLRSEYGTVFVHMNEEYVLITGWLWKLLGRRVVLWRNHKMGSWRTRIALAYADAVCYTSADSYASRKSPRGICMPVGIDTDRFALPKVAPASDTALFVGRIDPVKKADLFVAAVARVQAADGRIRADLCGSPTDPASSYAVQIKKAAAPLVASGVLALHPAVPYAEIAALYQAHALYVNLTPSGSFDKTILEAMASGCIVVCVNDAVAGVLPSELIARESPESVAAALRAALVLPAGERAALTARLRAYVEDNHSLSLLVSRLARILDA